MPCSPPLRPPPPEQRRDASLGRPAPRGPHESRGLAYDLMPQGSTPSKTRISHTSRKSQRTEETSFKRESLLKSRGGLTRRTRGAPTPTRAPECCALRPPHRPWCRRRHQRQPLTGCRRARGPVPHHSLRPMTKLHLCPPRTLGSTGRWPLSCPRGQRALEGPLWRRLHGAAKAPPLRQHPPSRRPPQQRV
jgi:hypothetical protein